MKKSILFSLFCFFSLISIAQTYFTYDGLNYQADNVNAPGRAFVTGIASSNPNRTEINIPDTVEYQGRKYFVYAIGSNAFQNEDLINVTMANTITTINSSAFSGCKDLISVKLSNSLSTISSNAFYNCKSLISITIPYSVTSIGSSAFYSCENLQDITCLAITPPTTGNFYCFFPIYYMSTTLHVPERSIEAYKAYDYWSYFVNIEGDAEDFNPITYNTDKCDTNGDGEVNIADINTVINRILSK